MSRPAPTPPARPTRSAKLSMKNVRYIGFGPGTRYWTDDSALSPWYLCAVQNNRLVPVCEPDTVIFNAENFHAFNNITGLIHVIIDHRHA